MAVTDSFEIGSLNKFALSGNDAAAIHVGDQRHYTHAWPSFRSAQKARSLVVTGGEGAYVYDAQGKRYLDGMGGLWCVNMGYGRNEIVEAIAEQARALPYCNPVDGLANAPAVRLAEKIASLAPDDLNHVFFTCGGSTANDSALRLIQFYQSIRGKPDKRFVLTRLRAYHGSTIMTASLGGNPPDRSPHLRFITDIVRQVSSPNLYRMPCDMSEAAFCDFLVEELRAKILELGSENIAAFFAEPILGSGGVIVPPKDYNRRTWELCKEYDILYVADEVITAFGRLGHFFSSNAMFETQPDIITFAKGITSGYQPLGGFVFSDAIHKVLVDAEPQAAFINGYTYSGHPVACAAALANIELMEKENICAHVHNAGAYFEKRLRALSDLQIVGDVRGSYFMMCIESVMDKSSKQPFPPNVGVGDIIARHASDLGLIVRPLGSMNILSPPLILNREQIDDFTLSMSEAIQRTQIELSAANIIK
ncbi:aminotransferase [Rhizobium sp. NPDC090279]|uniref:aminotransferase n=1 Tax=Rhizobium sp. NPDC090279 TaxID=3364499 RepID=UPI00383B39FB